MSATELDLTAAIEAARVTRHWQATAGFGLPEDVIHSQVLAALLNAALPHIREQLAQQIEGSAHDIERAQLLATGGVLMPLPRGIVAGHAYAASIVRGDS